MTIQVWIYNIYDILNIFNIAYSLLNLMVLLGSGSGSRKFWCQKVLEKIQILIFNTKIHKLMFNKYKFKIKIFLKIKKKINKKIFIKIQIYYVPDNLLNKFKISFVLEFSFNNYSISFFSFFLNF